MPVDNTQLRVPHEKELFIGSEWVTSPNLVMVDVISPATGQPVCQLPDAQLEDADLAVARARKAFDEGIWPRLTIAERRDYVSKFLKAFGARIEDIDRAQAIEAGMVITTAQGFSAWANMVGEDVVDTSKKIAEFEIRDVVGGQVEIRHEPVGPVLSILTYNGAHVVFALGVLPALLMGNTVVCKLPSETRLLGQYLADAAAEVGFPAGVLTIFTAGPEVSKHLVAHKDIDAIHFTGGTAVGSEIASVAGKRIARVTLELGGKSAAIVAEDADFDHAVQQIVAGTGTFQGQLCTALSRILVPREHHDELVQKLVAAYEGLKIGDPLDSKSEYGPLSERVMARAEQAIARAVEQGAEIATGGKRPAGFDQGWYLEPTLLVNVSNAMDIAQNEVFGPVFCVMPYDTLDEAIAIANDSDFGLAGSVFTTSDEVADEVVRRLRVGSLQVNSSTVCLVAPYGGMKQSGYGRVGGVEGLLEVTNIKTIQRTSVQS